jgi:hypothetical protein
VSFSDTDFVLLTGKGAGPALCEQNEVCVGRERRKKKKKKKKKKRERGGTENAAFYNISRAPGWPEAWSDGHVILCRNPGKPKGWWKVIWPLGRGKGRKGKESYLAAQRSHYISPCVGLPCRLA